MKKENVKNKEKTVEELWEDVVKKRSELDELIIKINTSEEKDTTKIKKGKKEIARRLTAISEKRKKENETK